jgi:acetate kinase
MLHMKSQEELDMLEKFINDKVVPEAKELFRYGHRVVHAGPQLVNAVFEGLSDQCIRHNEMTFTEEVE